MNIYYMRANATNTYDDGTSEARSVVLVNIRAPDKIHAAALAQYAIGEGYKLEDIEIFTGTPDPDEILAEMPDFVAEILDELETPLEPKIIH